jgi:hypothetical protein
MNLSSLIKSLTRVLRPEDRRTDVDFRPLNRPGPDVVAGWERRPHVPGSQDGGHVR